MPIDTPSGEITVRTRDEAREAYLRSYRLRNPTALIGEGSQPWIDANCLADQLMPLYANAQVVGKNVVRKSKTGTALDEDGRQLGVPRFAAVGAVGFVKISASAGGTTIFSGDEIRDLATGLRYQCVATALYTDGQSVPIAGIDTGPQTNKDAGVVLAWSNPRPGCGQTATVVAAADGTGLSGGRGIEDDDAYRLRLDEAEANPAASGNDAAYQREVEKTPSLQVEKCFTYPACNGPGTTGIAFTLKPQKPGASRRPSAAQIALVEAWIKGLFPADDSIFMVTLVAQNTDIVLDDKWAAGATNWVDAVPWPPRYTVGGTPGAIVVDSSPTPTATVFALKTDNGNYSGVVQPVAGQTIAFFDKTKGVFSRKRILSFTGTGPWTITCDTSNNASDTSYVPVAIQRTCPWSDSLDSLVAPIVAFFDTLGPGEQYSTFFDAGLRQRRNPDSPRVWPAEITNHVVVGVLDLETIQNAIIREGLGTTSTVGVPSSTAFLQELRYISAFPLS